MAQIIGGMAASHTPTIGFAFDQKKQDDPVWAPIFEAYEPIQQWIADKQPDVFVMIYNDHVTSFFFDHYSVFALGIDSQYAVADEGGGPRDLPPVIEQPGARRITSAQSLVADEFDMSFFQDKALDHGCFSPLSMMVPHEPDWPVQVVPLQVGVLQFPMPSARALLQARPGAARARSRATRKTCRWRSSPLVACRIRCTASGAASTTRRGTRSSCRSSRPIRSG